jgi:hypothetical protein
MPYLERETKRVRQDGEAKIVVCTTKTKQNPNNINTTDVLYFTPS